MDILGHDIEGRPLRVGDDCIVAKCTLWGEYLGHSCTILGEGCYDGHVEISIPFPLNPELALQALPDQLRKLHNDHLPADNSFEDMMRNLSSQDATTRNKELVS